MRTLARLKSGEFSYLNIGCRRWLLATVLCSQYPAGLSSRLPCRPRLMPAMATSQADSEPITRLRDITGLQWRSGIAAWLGWLFDGLDMHLYTLVALPFVAELLGAEISDPRVGTVRFDHPGVVSGWLGFGRRVLRANRRPAGTQPCAGANHIDLCDLHRPVDVCADLVAIARISFSGRAGYRR